MVYVAGIIGFFGGFFLGQMYLFFRLRNVSNKDLFDDKYIKWKYGLINWAFAIIGSYSAVSMYETYFL